MRTASLVLGIIGGVLAAIFGIIIIAGGALGGAYLNQAGQELGDLTVEGVNLAQAAVAGLVVWGIIAIIGAVLAFVGAGMVRKKNIVAGVLLLVAAIPSFFTGLGIIAAILLILAGVFALVPVKPEQSPTA